MILSDRSLNGEREFQLGLEEFAEVAAMHADMGIDSYSDYGVGVILWVEYDLSHSAGEEDYVYNLYGGCNINLSGMQVKAHAEQIALFQALMDMRNFNLVPYATLDKLVVVTTENDMSLRCGHCFQVLHAGCEYTGTDPDEFEYIAAKGQEMMTEHGPDGVHWTFDEYTLGELFPESYTSKREENIDG